MDYYDPHEAPNPEEWLAPDEAERAELVQVYHEEAGVELPSLMLHAAIHTTVENKSLWEKSCRSGGSSLL